MRFFAIVPFRPSNVDFMAEEYRRFAEASGQTLLLPSMSLHPEGEEPLEKVELFVAAYAGLKEKLRGSPVRLGVLLQTLIGHGWSSSNPAGNRFQTTVNHTGGTRGRICPLDENFLAYCEYAVGALAKCTPELFLLDDDTRLIDNNLLECFCPLHLAKFSAAYTREELTDLVIHAKPGDAILREFETVRRDSLEQFCRRIRAAIDAVNPALPCGLSGAGREHILFERMALAASGPHTEPFVRLGNALYFEGSAKELPRRFYQSEIQKKGCGSVRLLLDEAEVVDGEAHGKCLPV